MGARGRRYINRGKDAEDVCLHHAGEQTKSSHDNWENEWRDGQQNGDNHRPAHHVTEQTNRQSQRAGNFADDIKRQHDDCRLCV